MLYLGVSKTHEDQLRILQALTRKFKLDPELDLAAVAERCPFNYTGADFYALCSDAMLKAMARKAEEVEKRVGESQSVGTLEHGLNGMRQRRSMRNPRCPNTRIQ